MSLRFCGKSVYDFDFAHMSSDPDSDDNVNLLGPSNSVMLGKVRANTGESKVGRIADSVLKEYATALTVQYKSATPPCLQFQLDMADVLQYEFSGSPFTRLGRAMSKCSLMPS